MIFDIKLWFKQTLEMIQIKIAWKLPRTIVMWCALRLIGHATAGQWGHECPDDVAVTQALARWDVEHA